MKRKPCLSWNGRRSICVVWGTGGAPESNSYGTQRFLAHINKGHLVKYRKIIKILNFYFEVGKNRSWGGEQLPNKGKSDTARLRKGNYYQGVEATRPHPVLSFLYIKFAHFRSRRQILGDYLFKILV